MNRSFRAPRPGIGPLRLAAAFLLFTTVAVAGATGIGSRTKPATAQTMDLTIVSSSSGGTIGGVAFGDEDLLSYNPASGAWAMLLDGSDLGISGDIDAFAYISATELLISIDGPANLPGVGSVDDSDVLKFVPTSLGTNTAGTLEIHFDGSDVGLTEGGEDIDALSIGSGGELLISINGTATVDAIVARDDDVLAFTPTALGPDTAGSWSIRLDGSDVGLGGEDIWGLHVTETAFELTPQNNFSLGGVTGTGTDIVGFAPTSLGDETTGSFVSPLRFDGSASGAGSEILDAIHVGSIDSPPPTTTTTTTAATTTTTTPTTQADLAMTVTATPATVEVGETISYSATVVNNGPDPAQSVQLTATLSGNPSINPPAGCSSGSGSFSCSLGTLAAGGQTNLSFTAIPTVGGLLTASLSVDSSTFDGNGSNDSGGATTTVTSGPIVTAPVVLSSAVDGAVSGISYRDEDLVSYDPATDTFAMLVDGSDLGINGDIDAFSYLPDGSMLISLTAGANLPGVGQVDDSDVLRFSPTSIGETTTGTLEVYVDGSDVGLTTGGEDVDAVSIADDGRLLISVIGTFSVNGLTAVDDDILAFDATSFGPNTSGTWELYFDGSDQGLGGEDIWGVHVGTGIHLTTQNNFSVAGVSGTSADVFSFIPTELGANTTGSFNSSLLFDGSARGYSGLINAIHVAGSTDPLPEGLDIAAGFDWTLPTQAVRADDSGITWFPYDFGGTPLELANLRANDVYGEPGPTYTQSRYAILIDVLWKDVNPSEGVFDWSAIDAIVNDITLNGAPGLGYFLWPNVYGDRIPAWVNTKYGVDFGADPRQAWLVTNGAGGSAFNDELKLFIDEITARYANDPRLVHIDMRTVLDPDSGEWVIDNEIPSDAANIEIWANAMHQLWYQAFTANGADLNKLVSVVSRPVYGGNNVLAGVYSTDVGQRDGLPMRAHLWREAYGNSVDADGYVIVDESEPAITTNGLRYSEVTEYSFLHNNFGPKTSTYERFQIGLLWALQVRRNWLGFPFGFLDPDRVDRVTSAQLKQDLLNTQAMMRWAELEVGHEAATAPDAWAWTKETEYTTYNLNDDNPWDLAPSTTAKNVERWLYQRDVAADGTTVAVEPTPASQLPGFKRAGIECSSTLCEDYRARRTDRANGGTNMYFEVDAGFQGATAADMTIKITYYDDPGGDWHLEYRDGTGVVSTATVPSQGTGQIRTATFELPGFLADGQFAGGNDFRIVADGSGDATIRFVRLVKGMFN